MILKFSLPFQILLQNVSPSHLFTIKNVVWYQAGKKSEELRIKSRKMFQKGVIKGVIKGDTGWVLKARASVYITRAKILYFKPSIL